jgi:hypothetical protein
MSGTLLVLLLAAVFAVVASATFELSERSLLRVRSADRLLLQDPAFASARADYIIELARTDAVAAGHLLVHPTESEHGLAHVEQPVETRSAGLTVRCAYPVPHGEDEGYDHDDEDHNHDALSYIYAVVSEDGVEMRAFMISESTAAAVQSQKSATSGVQVAGLVLRSSDGTPYFFVHEIDMTHAVFPMAARTGALTVLVIRVDFSDDPGDPMTTTAISNMNTQVSAFYNRNSYNRVTMTATSLATQRMPQTKAYYGASDTRTTTLLNDAVTAAKNAGFDNTQYNYYIVAFNRINTAGWTWAGLGYVGSPGTWLNGYFQFRVWAHELGHNFGCWHANAWVLDSTSSPPYGTYSTTVSGEYQDFSDVMGANNNDRSDVDFNVQEKMVIGWVATGTPVKDLSQSSVGIYTVIPLDYATSLSQTVGLRVPRTVQSSTGSGNYYMLSYRANFGGTAYKRATGAGYVQFTYSTYGSGKEAKLVNMYPADNTLAKAFLPTGQTFNDIPNNIWITPVQTETWGAEYAVCAKPEAALTDTSDLQISITPSNSFSQVGTNSYMPLAVTATSTNDRAFAINWDNTGEYIQRGGKNTFVRFTTAGSQNVVATMSNLCGGSVTASKTVTVVSTASAVSLTFSVRSTSSTPSTIVADTTVTSTHSGLFSSTLQFTVTVNSGSPSNLQLYSSRGAVSALNAGNSYTATLQSTSPLLPGGTTTYVALWQEGTTWYSSKAFTIVLTSTNGQEVTTSASIGALSTKSIAATGTWSACVLFVVLALFHMSM